MLYKLVLKRKRSNRARIVYLISLGQTNQWTARQAFMKNCIRIYVKKKTFYM